MRSVVRTLFFSLCIVHFGSVHHNLTAFCLSTYNLSRPVSTPGRSSINYPGQHGLWSYVCITVSYGVKTTVWRTSPIAGGAREVQECSAAVRLPHAHRDVKVAQASAWAGLDRRSGERSRSARSHTRQVRNVPLPDRRSIGNSRGSYAGQTLHVVRDNLGLTIVTPTDP